MLGGREGPAASLGFSELVRAGVPRQVLEEASQPEPAEEGPRKAGTVTVGSFQMGDTGQSGARDPWGGRGPSMRRGADLG